MKRTKVAVGVLALFFAGTLVRAMNLEDWLVGQGDDAVIIDTQFDVIVAVVQARDGGGTTNGNPPELALDVVEIIRGLRGSGVQRSAPRM